MQNRHFGLYVAMQLCFVCAYFLHTREFSIDMIDLCFAMIGLKLSQLNFASTD